MRLGQRLGELRSEEAFRNYELARERVFEMLDNAVAAGDAGGSPSEYWSHELLNIEYLFDASPLVIDRLRHHCYHITGVWPYNYGAHRERSRAQHALKLEALLEAGDQSLFVPESPLLGGFGFELDAGLTNVDTLKFFEVMIALDRAELLGAFRADGERRTVWEIGSGWGGFPYVLKTLFPNTTYVVSDLPELFLFSATYLMTAFPGAKLTFHPGDGTILSEQEWAESDFVFVPAHALEGVDPPKIDLAINMVSFQEMTTEQVEGYVRHGYERKIPFFYSLNRERSFYNPELRGVTAIIDERYWLHEVEVLPVTYQQLPDVIPSFDRGNKKKLQQGAPASAAVDRDYHHIVGWRRLTT